ncbi:MAG TPA: hypothetical protein VLL52_22180 [Anaerolineae bacterium]|nr:hypothetical protein [Anaerolineae bacterium]
MSNTLPTPLIPLTNTNYFNWYDAETPTSYTPHSTYFAPYTIKPLSNTLYIGFSSARPAEWDGGLFAQYTANNDLQPITIVDEQGFVDLQPSPNNIYIPGVDPCCPDGWDYGNTYVYTPTTNTFKKYRNLPNVLHSWGIWYDESQSALYTVTGARTTTTTTPVPDWNRTGQILRSFDHGQTWTVLANRDGSAFPGQEGTGDSVGNHRAYDIIKFNNKLYLSWNDYLLVPPTYIWNICGLAVSDDNGLTWTRITDGLEPPLTCRTRLFIHNNHLLTLNNAQDELVAVNTDGVITTYPLPFQIDSWVYNYLATDNANRLYTVTDDGRIMRTTDFTNPTAWQPIAATNDTFVTLTYWPHTDQIIVASRGTNSNIWALDPATPNLNLPTAPTMTITLNNNEINLQWASSPTISQYHLYHSTTPYNPRVRPTLNSISGETQYFYQFQTPPTPFLTNHDSLWQQTSNTTITDTIRNTQFYRIRAGASPQLSPAPPTMVGAITYSITAPE